MNEAGDEGKANHAEINGEKARVAIYPRQQNVTDAGQKNRGHNNRSRPVAIDEMADERRLDGALRARQRESQRCRGATKSKILADREKENREAELMQSAADHADERNQSDHAPAVKNVRGNIGQKTDAGARSHSPTLREPKGKRQANEAKNRSRA